MASVTGADMSAGFIYLFRTQQTGVISRLEAGLLDSGLGLRRVADTAELCSTLERSAADEVQLVLLADSAQRNIQAAREIRRYAPRVTLMALQSDVHPNSLICALQNGIDVCWPAAAPVALVVSGVLRLVGHCGGSAVALDQPQWRLVSQGWMVQAPDGRSVTLTAAEKAIVGALCNAPHQQLSHDALLRAVEYELQPESSFADSSLATRARPAARRMSVLVSRLRHKLAAAGIHMPIRSVRGRGYQLSITLKQNTVPPAARAALAHHAVAAEPVSASFAREP